MAANTSETDAKRIVEELRANRSPYERLGSKDILDVQIFDISPDDTPFMTSYRRDKTKFDR